MKTLELKDIAGYLPYGLSVKCKVSNDHGVYYVLACEIIYEKIRLSGARSTEWYGFDKIKPYLRPMSDLTKKIIHGGKTFVPIDVLKNICRFIEFDDAGLIYSTAGCLDSDWRRVFDLLSEWMFDYRSLIPAGLAIDMNTLPENPYEK